MNHKLQLFLGDITQIPVDAIVNAANTSLLGGGGVDGVIHKAGGQSILEQCQNIRAKQGGCKVGQAVITGAGNLPAHYVIHTVGPRWSGGNRNEAELLYQAYQSCFHLAKKNTVASISFPNISTGIYGYPREAAAKIALKAIMDCLQENSQIERVNIVCFENENFAIYDQLMKV